MAKVEYSFPVEKVHGKVSKKHKVGFAHRADSNLNYIPRSQLCVLSSPQ